MTCRFSDLDVAKTVVPLRTMELGYGLFRSSDLRRALERTSSLAFLHFLDPVFVFTDDELPGLQRSLVQSLQLETSTRDFDIAIAAYLLDPRSAVDIRHVQAMRILQSGAGEPAPEAVAGLIHAMHGSLQVLEIVAPRLNNRGRMLWSPAVLAPRLATLSFVFSRRPDRKHAPEVLREVFRDVRNAVALERLYVELSLPCTETRLQYLGETMDENDGDIDLCQDVKWKAFEITLLYIRERYVHNFQGVYIKVHGQGADKLRRWLKELDTRNLLSVMEV